MKKIKSLVVLLMVAKIINAQPPVMFGARHAALAFATSAVRDEWAIWSNPAGLSHTAQLVLATAAEHYRTLPGADRKAFTINCPLWKGGVAIGVYRFGNELYSENIAALAFGHQLGIAALGIRVDLLQYRTDGQRYTLPGITFGGIADIHERFSIGAWVSNINQPKFPDGQLLPVRMTAGPLFRPADGVLIAVSVEKDLAHEVSCRAGMEYRIHKKFFTRTGFRMFPSSAHFGGGFHTQRLKIDYALQFTRSTNHAHQLSLAVVAWRRQQK